MKKAKSRAKKPKSTGTPHRHEHVSGASGAGKTTALSRLMSQMVSSGKSFVVIDPHGELASDICTKKNKPGAK